MNPVRLTEASEVWRAVRASRQSWPLKHLDGGPDSWWITGSAALAIHLHGRWHRLLGDLDVTVSRTATVVCIVNRPTIGQESWTEDFRVWFAAGPTDLLERKTFIRSCGDGLPISFRSVELPAGAWRSACRPRLVIKADEAILRSDSGVSYLAPELVLLGKSRQLRAKDHEDFVRTVPQLGPEVRARLVALLPAKHPWHDNVVLIG